uniref:NADH-ubiquinone oxidoreductase chain 4 n=1 Tax=Therophilus festivus TaxID=1421599 RepID=A0A0A6ZL21_9HYME|nr:NADH dehydrogenase subunit 4 [Therophilus festivus]
MMKIIFFMISLFILMNFKLLLKNMLNYLFILFSLMFFNYNLLNLNFMNFKYNIMGIDMISYILILLTIWIISLSILSNLNFLFNNFNYYYIFNMLLLFIIIMFSFCSLNMLMFYIMFESSLIPMIILIMGWGMQIDRIQAMLYMLLYTLIGSLPFFYILIFQYNNYFSLMFNLMMMFKIFYLNFFMFIFMFMGFFVKLPMYFFHLWLPKAHVEAPISGSMILASIMLKLGTYGMIRLMYIYYKMILNFNMIFINLMIIGSIYSCMICFNSMDLKIIIAYSSIVHMNFMISILLMFSFISLNSNMILMISHGLCSPAMFCLANFNYEKLNSRNIFINKGMINLFPSMSMWWFLIFSNNFSSPPSLNLMGELMLSFKFLNFNILYCLFLFLIMMFCTFYSIYIYSFSQHGNNLNKLFFFNMNCKEYLIMILHWLPMNILFLNLNFLL